MMRKDEKTIALTIGDPNGIGPEIAVKAACEMRGNAGIRVILVGDEHVIRHYGGRHADGLRLEPIDGRPPADRECILFHPAGSLPVASFRPGHIESDAGRATVAYVDAAIRLVRQDIADAIIGCPHNETAVNAAGIPFSGYPGLIARLT